MRDILEGVAAGRLSVEEALGQFRLYAVEELEGLANLDVSRSQRRGLPEIVRCRNKPAEEAVALAAAHYEATGRAVLSGAAQVHRDLLAERFPDARLDLDERAGLLVMKGPAYRPPTSRGVVGIVTGGTSDIPVARQAEIIAKEAGCAVHTEFDVGVAGLHRLFPAVRRVLEADCDVVIAVAGQEGALATVLAGLVDIPVIGLPTSTGTGYGGEGIGALMAMLQACSMGVATVNIDNGIAAGTVAAAIARRTRRD